MTGKISMSKRQKWTIIIGGAVAVILLLVYLIVLRPLLAGSTTTVDPPELLPGEVLGTDNRILMMEHIEKADIQSIEVHNSFGGYTFYRANDDNFYLKDMEGAPYSNDILAALVVTTGYTLSMTRVTTDCQDFHEYGLAEADDPAYFIIKKTDGTTHKVWIGSLIATGGGYYARYDGRNAVYVLDTTLASTVLADVNTMITPVLGYPIASSDSYMMDDYYLIRDGEIIAWVDYLDPTEIVTEAGMGDYVMKYPDIYTVNISVMSTLSEIFATFNGTETVEFGKDIYKYLEHYDEDGNGEEGENADGAADEDAENEAFVKRLKETYGIDIDNPHYLVHYTYREIETFIIFSKPDENGDMYAFSSLYDLVAKINISACDFLEWDLLRFIERGLYGQNINDIAKIEVSSDIVNATFTLEGTGADIIIKANGSDTAFDLTDVNNFRQWYKVILDMKVQDYSLKKDPAELTLYATIVFTKDDGTVLTYCFYPYSSHHCFYTIGGKGEFYTLNSDVEKVLTDCVRLLNGDRVNAG